MKPIRCIFGHHSFRPIRTDWHPVDIPDVVEVTYHERCHFCGKDIFGKLLFGCAKGMASSGSLAAQKVEEGVAS